VLKITISAEIDVLKNRGTLVVRLFFIKVFSRGFFLDLDKLRIKFDTKRKEKDSKNGKKLNSIRNKKRKKNKTLEIHINADKKNKQSTSMLFSTILKNVEIRQADIELSLGIAYDAFTTSIVLVGLQTLLNIGIVFLRTKFDTKVNVKSNADYNNNNLQLKTTVHIYFSIISIFKGLFIIIWHKINKAFKYRRTQGYANNRHKKFKRKAT